MHNVSRNAAGIRKRLMTTSQMETSVESSGCDTFIDTFFNIILVITKKAIADYSILLFT